MEGELMVVARGQDGALSLAGRAGEGRKLSIHEEVF